MNENGYFAMKRTSGLQFLIFISVFCSCTLESSDFYLISDQKSYEEAKTYCRDTHTDLATVHNSSDMTSLINLVSTAVERAWIGLEIGDVWMWYWSLSGHKTDFFKWKAEEPQKTDQEGCAAMDMRGEWFESDCNSQNSFVCHDKSDARSHMFFAEAKSWRDAQSHCRNLSSDLVSIHSEEENVAVRSLSASQTVWIGLFKDPWKWLDGSNSSFRFWKPNQPQYSKNQECVAAVFIDEGKWNNRKCDKKFSFICHGAQKSIPATTASQTTPGSITADQPPENRTTLSAEMSTQLFPAITDSPTQSSTLMTIINSQSVHSENLILIQENMTWIDALSYCREHYIDLVHITNKEIQDKVAEMVKNATSAHVWLGMHYTCAFKFWFWTGSTSSCYQNWMAGQGPEGVHECGTSGAIETTGRQQWVGLPETEELNFICSACGG